MLQFSGTITALAMQPSEPRAVLRFGPFEADLRTSELRKYGTRIRLQEQPFRVLALLLQRPGQLVSREEIRAQLWPADTFVDYEHGLNTAIRRLRDALCDSPERPHWIETLKRRGYRFIGPVEQLIPAAGINVTGRQTVAVLPFADLSGSAAQEHFADGVTEEIITTLAKLSGLRVISRTSTMRYKDVRRSVPEIARELGVDAIVEGTVLRSGDSVRITAQLIESATDTHLWAESYRRELAEILDLQSEIARNIAERVCTRLTAQEHAQLAGHLSIRPQVYELYLQARYAVHQLTPTALERSIRLYRLALEFDPHFAAGWSGLAAAFCWHPAVTSSNDPEYLAQARRAALKALELDPASGEARMCLAFVRHAVDWNTAAAESEFQRALQLAPSNSVTHAWYGAFLSHIGRFSESRECMGEALRLDPFSAYIRSLAEIPLLRSGDAAAFFAQVSSTQELEPNAGGTLRHLVLHYEQTGDFLQAIAYRERLASLAGESPNQFAHRFSEWRLAVTNSGAVGYWKRLLVELQVGSQVTPSEPFTMAVAYAALGEAENAFAMLNEAVERRSPLLRYRLNWAPQFSGLRSDSRFDRLLDLVGLSH